MTFCLMRKNWIVAFIALLLFTGKIFGQAGFSYTPLDTLTDSFPGAEVICYATLINSTANVIPLRVTREKNVMGDAPGWISTFCIDICYLPTDDSIDYTFDPGDTVNFSFHFWTDANPDSACGIMKWKNTNTSSSIVQRFHGITWNGFGVPAFPARDAVVDIYPMPVGSNQVFTLNISNIKPKKNISFTVYNILGSVVNTTNAITGINFMNLNLPSGIYSYSLISDNTLLNSGKLAIGN